MTIDIELLKLILDQIEKDFLTFPETDTFSMYIKDISGHYLCANKKFLDSYGIKNVVGKTDQELFNKTLANYISEKDLSVVNQNKPIIFIENVNGNYFKSVRFPINDLLHNLSFIWYIGLDITKIEYSRKELMETVNSLENANTSVSSFIERMRHEVKTPLNAIIGFTYTILESNLTESQRSLLDKVLQSAKILSSKFETLFDYNKINSKVTQLNTIKVKVETIVNEVAKKVNAKINNTGIKLNIIVEENVPKLITTSKDELIKSIVLIILYSISAIDTYSARGGKIALKISAQKQSNYMNLNFEITDNAPSLSKDIIEQITNPFYFMNDSGSAELDDIGINLTLADGYINLLNSKLNIENFYTIQPNHTINTEGLIGYGNKYFFDIHLDLVDVEYDVYDNEDNLGLKNIKILLVEDNIINQQIVREILEGLGAEVSTAGNGLEAINIYNQNSFDLILVDIEMPVLNGYDMAQKIMIKEDGKKIPIIALTALDFESEKQKCFASGMVDVLTKPVIVQELIDVIIKNLYNGKKDMININVLDKNATNKSIFVNIKSIDSREGLSRVCGNESLYLDLLSKFISRYENFALDLRKTINEGNIKEALSQLHGLKGASGNIAAKKVYKNCITLKESIDNNNAAKIIINIQYLHDSIIELSREIENITASSSENKSDAIDSQKIKHLLSKLHKCIAEDINLAVVFDYLDELKKYLFNTSYNSQYEEIKKAIDKFDLLKADKYVTDLMKII